jgi:hypothetical protein
LRLDLVGFFGVSDQPSGLDGRELKALERHVFLLVAGSVDELFGGDEYVHKPAVLARSDSEGRSDLELPEPFLGEVDFSISDPVLEVVYLA